jgi:hypothetical protein
VTVPQRAAATPQPVVGRRFQVREWKEVESWPLWQVDCSSTRDALTIGNVIGGSEMPPHCDALDGPVVRAAQRALDAANVTLVLPFVPKSGEKEVIEVFGKYVEARQGNAVCRDVADRYFFETVVRVHRADEGAAFTGLKPPGLDVGPVIPIAEKVIESRDAAPLEDVLVTAIREELAHRLDRLCRLHDGSYCGVEGARAYVKAMLGLQVWAHGVYVATKAKGHTASHRDGNRLQGHGPVDGER